LHKVSSLKAGFEPFMTNVDVVEMRQQHDPNQSSTSECVAAFWEFLQIIV